MNAPRDEFPAYNEIMALLYGKPARQYLPDIISILGNIDGTDVDVVPLLTRLLTTGSADARKEVRDAFKDIARSFQTAYDEAESSRGNESMDEEESRWESFLDGYERPVIRNNLLGVWNAANVLDESGGDMSVKDVIAGMRTMPFVVDDLDPDLDEQADSDPYWRGLAAVAISRYANHVFVTMDRGILSSTVPGFIEWAGSSDSIATVIDIARERGSFDCALLEQILAERGERTALSIGVL